MPAFLRLTRTGPIALFALSLSAFVPVGGHAQEITSAEQPAPMAPVPADWVPHSHFGLQFALPPTLELGRESNEPGNRGVSFLHVEEGTRSLFTMRLAPPEETAQLPAQGTDAYRIAISEMMDVPLTLTDQTLTLGDMLLHVYSGNGTRVVNGDQLIGTRMLFLVADAPLASGETLWIGYLNVGSAVNGAEAAEAAFLASLQTENGVDIGAVAPGISLEGQATLAVPSDSAEAEMAEADSVAPAESPADLTTPPATPEAEPAPVEPPVAEAPTQADATPATPLVDGLASVTLAPDVALTALTGDAAETWATFAHPDYPEAVHTAFMVAQPGPDAEALAAMLLDRFNAIDSVQEGSHDGVPVWIISGASRSQPDGTPVQSGAPHAQYMVTQACLPGGGPVVLGIVTTATRAAPPILEIITSTLGLTMPATATPCAADIGAAVTALPIGAIAHAPVVPDLALDSFDRFGVHLVTLEGMQTRRDQERDGVAEFTRKNRDSSTSDGSEITLRIMSPSARDQITTAPSGSPEFLATLAHFAGVPLVRTGETVPLGAMVLDVIRGDGTVSGRDNRVLYLISRAPSATGQNVWIGILNVNVPEAEAAALEQAVIDGLALTDAARFDGTETVALLDGAVRIAVLPGQVVTDRDERSNGARLALSAAADTPAHTLFAMERRTDADPEATAALSQRVARIDTVSDGVIDGYPVWIFEGGTDRLPDLTQPAPGQTSPAWLAITQDCAPGAGPVVLGALATQAYLDQVGGFDAVIAPVRLTLPEGSTPCPAPMFDAVAAVGITLETPQRTVPDPVMPPPPAVQTGKPTTPPVAAPDPAEDAWVAAVNSNSAQGMMAYLNAYPDGAHTQEARDWLAMHAPRPADPDTEAWQAALALGTAPAMWTYLKAQPNGAYAAQARAELQALTAPPPMPTPTAPQPSFNKRG